ncbi:MAG: anti-sigma factor antagonist [Phycisphaerae bacterium]|nr:anti-sigma factor antagonist [Phycisphaerae bacterium]
MIDMKIIRQDDEVTIVSLSGKLDAIGAAEIEDRFLAATAVRKLPTIVDLSQLDFIMSCGMTLLTHCYTELKKSGAHLVLLSPLELVEKTLHCIVLDKLMPIAHNLDDALKLVQTP